MREGGLEAPTRHPIAWRNSDFFDAEKLDAELRRVFDICHGCRRCFNLCDSFPRLFDLIDATASGELAAVESASLKTVVDACTLCDMCFMTKCPYVPPHEFNIDFPHLILRHRAAGAQKGGIGFAKRQLTETDRNGRLGCSMPAIVNWATDRSNRLTRPLMETLAGVHRKAALPKYHAKTFQKLARSEPLEVNLQAPAHGRKAVIFATCFSNYNSPGIGQAARAVLARNGIETETVYPACCGMPQLEQGDIARVAGSTAKVAAEMRGWIGKGYDVVSLLPSCSLMLKLEWPLILPGNEDVKSLSQATFDASEYIIDIAGKEGLAEGLSPLDGGIAVHIACHARAQNMGRKGAEMLRLLPDTEVSVIERCSGHGGTWGMMKDNFDLAMKLGGPVIRKAAKGNPAHVVSECPLAREHIVQGIEGLDGDATGPSQVQHPIQLIARSYGL